MPKALALDTVATAVLSATLTFTALTFTAAGPAEAQAAAAADECRTSELTGNYARITGGRVAARTSPRRNAEILRADGQLLLLRTGDVMATCGLSPTRGAYANKCGFRGNRWLQVRVPGNAQNRSGRFVTTGYIPQTCARVVSSLG